MVPGANGAAAAFQGVAGHLAASHTVVTYDRRGFSGSRLEGPQDHGRRLETDADDVRRLIEHLGDEPAILFGASSGGIVVLEVLIRHPAVVRVLLPFEPPAVRQLPDGQRWLDFFAGVYDLYRQRGPTPALESFGQVFADSDRRVLAAIARAGGGDRQVTANAAYWFEHELRQYPAVELDLDALRARADRIVLVGGRESRGRPAFDVNLELGRRLGLGVVELPGGHLGFIARPAEFARELVAALVARARKE
jgi:pimeloyl-ACP methyl ester carboxylesterase